MTGWKSFITQPFLMRQTTKYTKQMATSKIKLALKGILFYATIIAVSFFIAGIDSIYDEGYFFVSIIIVSALVYACYKLLSKDEVDTLLLMKYFSKWEPEDDKW